MKNQITNWDNNNRKRRNGNTFTMTKTKDATKNRTLIGISNQDNNYGVVTE